MDEAMATGTQQPAKIVLDRRVKAGFEAQFEHWLRQLIETTSQARGLEGSSVLTTGGGEYFVLLRFAAERELEAWQSSPLVLELMEEGDRYASACEATVRTGLETWFHLPGVAPIAPPAKWKMALLTWLALIPQVILLAKLVPPSWPFLVNVALTTAIPVSMLTWVVMPRLARLLAGWLYVSSSPAPQDVRGAPHSVSR